MSEIPADLKYTKTHEWLRIEGDQATIGITDFAQSELGDVVYIDLKNAGLQVKPGDVVGSVESVKTVSDVYAPLEGEILDTNPALGAQPELVNSDPYGRGYLLKIKFSGSPPSDLLDAAAYSSESGSH